jgi:HemY protein
LLKFILLVIQLIFLLSITLFLVSNSFNVSFDIGDLSYSFNSNLLVISFVILIVITILINFIYFKTKFSFQKYVYLNKIKKTQKGYDFFVEAMIALLNKDNKSAIISSKKMKSLLKEESSLNLLLQSEILKIENKSDQLNNVYDLMIKDNKTKTLGYRGLMEQSLKQQDYHHAFIYGEKLFLLNPKIEKLYDTLVSIIAKTRNWNQLIVITENAYANNIIKKEELYENKSIAMYEIAKIKMKSNVKEATNLIEKAINMKKNFSPYIKLYIEILFSTNKINKIQKVLKKYWNELPSNVLRLSITEVLKKNKISEISFIKNFVYKNKENEESKKLLVDFAIYLSEWSIAREHIQGLIGSKPTKETCLFMSQIELGEFNDIQKSEGWKLRANNAEVDNYWVCKITNNAQKEWSALSESGHFNSLEWRQPKMLSYDS